MAHFPNLILHAVPGFILLIIVEVIIAIKTQKELYEIKDTAASICVALGHLFSGFLTNSLVLLAYLFAYEHRLFTIPYSAWWAWILCFFADDFSYYWFHRSSHSIRWFWASHSVHHTSEHYNLAAALRQSWTGNISGAFIFWIWMPFMGFEPGMILMMQSISLLYQFWIHTETIQRMPTWYESIFNTPSHHRVHHGSDLLYLDKNHAGILIIWDKLFNTFQQEHFKPKYGLTKNLQTFNPIRVAFHEWIKMYHDLKKANKIKDLFRYLFNAPGWSHDGSSKTTHELRKDIKN